MIQSLFDIKTKMRKQQSTFTLKYFLPTALLIIFSIVAFFSKNQIANNIKSTASGLLTNPKHPLNSIYDVIVLVGVAVLLYSLILYPIISYQHYILAKSRINVLPVNATAGVFKDNCLIYLSEPKVLRCVYLPEEHKYDTVNKTFIDNLIIDNEIKYMVDLSYNDASKILSEITTLIKGSDQETPMIHEHIKKLTQKYESHANLLDQLCTS